jgi:DNA-binding GntR family transcriptional regulator
VLLAISEMLWLRSGPSLRVMLGRHGTANLPDKHREALAAMRARDPDAVEQAIRDDIEQGIAQVTRSLGPA